LKVFVPTPNVPTNNFALTPGTDVMTANEISCLGTGKLFTHGAKKIAQQVGYLLGDPESFHSVSNMSNIIDTNTAGD
jgi:hypothetical protein